MGRTYTAPVQQRHFRKNLLSLFMMIRVCFDTPLCILYPKDSSSRLFWYVDIYLTKYSVPNEIRQHSQFVFTALITSYRHIWNFSSLALFLALDQTLQITFFNNLVTNTLMTKLNQMFYMLTHFHLLQTTVLLP